MQTPRVLLDRLAWWWLSRRHASAQHSVDETVDELEQRRENANS
jgi:hypothetical protein